MHNKISYVISSILAVSLILSLFAITGCKPDSRNRMNMLGLLTSQGSNVVVDAKGNPIGTESPSGDIIDNKGRVIGTRGADGIVRGKDGRVIEAHSIRNTTTVSPLYKTAYVLSIVNSSVLQNNNIATQNLDYYQQTSRNYTPTQNYSSANRSGSFGVISVVGIEDKSLINANQLDVISAFQYSIPNFTSGITGVTDGRIAPVDEGVTDESFIDILPDGSSLLVSSPDTEKITQFILNENGRIIGRHEIKLRLEDEPGAKVRPTRFVASRDFKTNPYVFVATNRGIATIYFDYPSEHVNASGIVSFGRRYGTIEPLVRFPQQAFNPSDRVPKVYDIAITADNRYIYASNEYREIYFKEMQFVEDQVPFTTVIYNNANVAKKLTSIPKNTVNYLHENFNTFSDQNGNQGEERSIFSYLHSVAALTDNGLSFVNSSAPSTFHRWGQLTPYNPVDIEFHSDGKSVIVLCKNYMFIGKFIPRQSGLYLSNQTFVKGDAKEMDVDPDGKFIAVAASSGLSLFRLDKGGIVSPSDLPARIEGRPVSVAVR